MIAKLQPYLLLSIIMMPITVGTKVAGKADSIIQIVAKAPLIKQEQILLWAITREYCMWYKIGFIIK